jgi:hypothetical protein
MEIVYKFIVSPSEGVKRIEDSKPFFWAISIFLLALASNTIGNLLVLSPEPHLVRIFLTLGLTGRIVVTFFLWLGATALLHLFAEAWRGRGRVSTLFIVLGFASLPLIFSSPLALVAKFCGPGKLAVYILFSFFIFIWTAVLQILGLKATYAFSTARAILTYLSPLFLGILMMGFLLSLLFLSIGSFLSLMPAL